VGPNGIFVIEVKANRGEIQGGVNDAQWRARKVGRRGAVYYSTFGNPIRQVRGATATLAEHLRGQGVKTWVQAILCFTNDNARLRFNGVRDVIVARPETLSAMIQKFQPKRASSGQDQAENAIAALLEPAWVRSARMARGGH